MAWVQPSIGQPAFSQRPSLFSNHSWSSDHGMAATEPDVAGWDASASPQLRSGGGEPPQPGVPLSYAEIRQAGLYYEHQAAGSDTCGLNALNNLCQRQQFTTADLQQAEAAHAQAQSGGNFALITPASSAPTGFFDVEALKIAAGKVNLEIVDVEPVPDYRRSQCFAFTEVANQCSDGSWLLGFLVYDRQPGQMHYYALRRDERFARTWLKFDSQLAEAGSEQRNRRLGDDDLWGLYESSRHLFQAWIIRWYPVLYRAGAAQEVCRVLHEKEGHTISEARALAALKESRWLVSAAVTQLLQSLPQATVRELLVQFARPSEGEMRSLLEAAGWDLGKAQPVIDQVLKQRVALAQGTREADPIVRRALSCCDWDPKAAATLLALRLQTGHPPEKLQELHEALTLVQFDLHYAESVLQLLPSVGTLAEAARLLRQTPGWSVPTARRVLEVRQRFSRVSVPVAVEVLRRNDDDPHAAKEMLAEYEKRIQRLVLDNAAGDIFQGEEVEIAEAALSSTDWDPSNAFVAAKNLSLAVQSVRRLLRQSGRGQFVGMDSILTALTAADMKPRAALSLLLGSALPPHETTGRAGWRDAGGPALSPRSGPSPPPPAGALRGEARTPAAPREGRQQLLQEEEEESTCSIA